MVALPCTDDSLYEFDTVLSSVLSLTEDTSIKLFDVAYTPDGRFFITVGEDGYVRVFRQVYLDSVLQQTLQVNDDDYFAVTISPSGRQAAVGNDEGEIHVFSAVCSGCTPYQYYNL